MNQIKIGFIGLDTSHVVAFSKVLHDSTSKEHVPGARVTVAFPGGSKDFPLSINRVDGFTKELREQHDVKIVDSPEAVAEASDLVFIESADGRVHLEQFKRIVGFRKPTFIDKPLTVDVGQAREIFRLAEQAGVPVMSCSSLRYSEQLVNTLAGGRQDVFGCDVFGPMSEEPTQPGLFWYGIHSVELLVTAMGPGCVEVRAFRNDGYDLVTAIYLACDLPSSFEQLRGARGVGDNARISGDNGLPSSVQRASRRQITTSSTASGVVSI